VTTTGPLPPAVLLTPAESSFTNVQPVKVTIEVSGGSSDATPAGSVTLKSGSYTSAPKTLTGGSVVIQIPAGSLPIGTDTLTAIFEPAASSAKSYEAASGTATVTVGPTPGLE
jgi:hypothetical protein